MIEVAVRKRIQSLNIWQRLHWAKRKREKDEWITELIIAMTKQGPRREATEKRRVQITSYRKKLLDHDNLVGGAKPLVDALVDLKLIKDDSPEWVEIEYRQKQQSLSGMTTVKIINSSSNIKENSDGRGTINKLK